MSGVRAIDAERSEVYVPERRPGFVAWATGFDYGDGRVGLSFKETKGEPNPRFIPPRLEMAEAVGAPVSYGSVECGSGEQTSYRVYLASDDSGDSWYETGRCDLEEGSFANIGFPDGRIIGLDVPRINADRTGWCDFIDVRESVDGGTSWAPVARLLEGEAPYLWRIRRLRDGTYVILASLYGTPWGLGRERATRNTMLPGETYIGKIQPFFLTTRDGRTFDGPHYVLAGTGAHEFDVVELDDETLLFIAGDVQATPVGRQLVRRDGERFYPRAVLPIGLGAPADPRRDPQGGWVPESVVATGDGLLVGSRRGKPYSVSNDRGENWHPVEGLPPSLYQPYLMTLPDGRLANFGHVGSDSPFGEEDMVIGVDRFRIGDSLPPTAELTLTRRTDPSGDTYLNSFTAWLHRGEEPIPGVPITFRFVPVWNADGTVDTRTQAESTITIEVRTDVDGVAVADAVAFDRIGDIHFAYNVDAVSAASPSSSPARSATMCVLALTPRRRDAHPHIAYLAHGILHLAPDYLDRHPDLPGRLRLLAEHDPAHIAADALPPQVIADLLAAGVLRPDGDAFAWLPSVHAPQPLVDVQPQQSGEWFV
ncbi:hypothetical protein [Microbacterium sp.]|mgnify:FL=1|uniref:hypothetical protein n=1 Tax=Microbacterium sp. TaxID=51671 RepID=UPI0009282EA2|nr:hypothetical protein [Microbacterium sp.]MBN9193026.1 hypothetical protein [Microbacterium sp.]OJU61363.1 MAG: hypothetical protein BGO04_10730 [Microbacterium sp. 70-38]